MPTILTLDDAVNEEGSAIVEVSFEDEDGQSVTPNTGTYTLTDEDGTVINSLEDTAISNLAATSHIVLSGDDLQIADGFSGAAAWRILTVEYTYDSQHGNDLPAKDTLKFPVNNLAAVT